MSAMMFTITPPLSFIHALNATNQEHKLSESSSCSSIRNCQHVNLLFSLKNKAYNLHIHSQQKPKAKPLSRFIYVEPSLQHKNVPLRLVSITAFQPFALIMFAGLENCPPPLFTKKSILPWSFRVEAIRFFTCQKCELNNISSL